MEILGGACLLSYRNGIPVLPDRSTAADTTLTKALARAWRHVGKGPNLGLGRFVRLEKRPSVVEDGKAHFTFPRLAIEPGKVDIAPRISHVAAGVDGWLQLPDQSDHALVDLIGIQI
jgi:hypothetical protein